MKVKKKYSNCVLCNTPREQWQQKLKQRPINVCCCPCMELFYDDKGWDRSIIAKIQKQNDLEMQNPRFKEMNPVAYAKQRAKLDAEIERATTGRAV